MIKLSIIIVAYKNLDCLADCLASIPEFSWLEVIVVNNSHQNRGFGTACNLGASLAKGECLLFINPDCLVNKDLIIGIKRRLERDETIGLIAPAIIDSRGKRVLSVSRQPIKANAWIVYSVLNKILKNIQIVKQHWYEGVAPKIRTDVGIASGAVLGIKKQLFNKLKGFDEDFFLYWEEVDLAKRCLEMKYRVVFEPKLTAVHHGALSTVEPKVTTLSWFRQSRFTFFKKHFGIVYASLLEGWLAVGEHWPLVLVLGMLSSTGSVAAVVLTIMVYNEMIVAGRLMAAITGGIVGLIVMPWGIWGIGFGLGWAVFDLSFKESIWRKLYLVGIIILCLAL